MKGKSAPKKAAKKPSKKMAMAKGPQGMAMKKTAKVIPGMGY